MGGTSEVPILGDFGGYATGPYRTPYYIRLGDRGALPNTKK